MLIRPVRKLPLAHPVLVRAVLVPAWVALAVTAFTRCSADVRESPAREQGEPRSTISSMFGRGPDELPKPRDPQVPFRYPAALYAQKVQGNVTLRIHVDTTGAVVPDSTRIEESSGNIALDSAALLGAGRLSFTPAKRRGSAIAVSLLYPVYFRHPEAEPLPGDSLLAKP